MRHQWRRAVITTEPPTANSYKKTNTLWPTHGGAVWDLSPHHEPVVESTLIFIIFSIIRNEKCWICRIQADTFECRLVQPNLKLEPKNEFHFCLKKFLNISRSHPFWFTCSEFKNSRVQEFPHRHHWMFFIHPSIHPVSASALYLCICFNILQTIS